MRNEHFPNREKVLIEIEDGFVLVLLVNSCVSYSNECHSNEDYSLRSISFSSCWNKSKKNREWKWNETIESSTSFYCFTREKWTREEIKIEMVKMDFSVHIVQ